MKRVLCYGDSNTWGYDPVNVYPETGFHQRYPEQLRWPGVMQKSLGTDYHVYEHGLGSRTTIFDDPDVSGKNGLQYLPIALDTCDPLDCIIFSLGTNDTKDCFQASVESITCGMERLIQCCQNQIQQNNSRHAKIIIACPIVIHVDGTGNFCIGFSTESAKKGMALRSTYRALALRLGCEFIDLNEIVTPDIADGIHLSAESHRMVGVEMAKCVKRIFESNSANLESSKI